MAKIILLTCLMAMGLAASAQTDCVDPNAANPTFQCIENFDPVCACDGKTYFSRCDAINHHGVNQFSQFNSGVCGDWDMFLGQDAPNKLIRLFFQFKSSGGNITFLIVDIYGKIMQQLFVSAGNNLPQQRDISTAGYPPGIYIAYAFGGSNRKTIKFSAGNF